MALHRENILALIGSRRYHSAILTTFSFDFYFFEMKAMKWLRSCGVRNVNVLIDGHYYSELMLQPCGEEMNLSPGYSLYPVFQKSLFHPKIWMLFGEKEALLIIGSGNLTNAGNGNNEEIWGAFHFDIRFTENSQLFSAAWSYIQQLCSSVKGLTHEKTTRWIVDHAPWLNELPAAAPFQFHDVAGKWKVAFLANTAQRTIWQQLVDLIGTEKVVEITTLSPYYDTNGKAIQALSSLFKPAKLNVIIDETGSVPDALPLSKAYSFFDWYNMGVSKKLHVKSSEGSSNSKLHAKIIHFRTSKGKEYCLFGSANVTPEGLGLSGITANAEASLLMYAKEGGLLTHFGIKLKSPVKLSAFKTSNDSCIYDTILKYKRPEVMLLSAEWVYDELYLYAEGYYDKPLVAKLYDHDSRLLHTLNIGAFKPEMKTKPSVSLQGLHQIQLFDAATDTDISNRILLADYYLLAKTHPNPQTEDIERIYNDIQGGELTRILDLLHYAILDEAEYANSTNILANKTAKAVNGSAKDGPDKLYDLASYKPIEQNTLEKSLLLSSLSLRVLDVLTFIQSSAFTISTESELRADEQEENLGNISGVDESAVSINRNIPLAQLKSERKKLLHYFNKLSDHQHFLVYIKENPKEYRPSLTDLTKYLIALELMLQFGGKLEKYVEMNTAYFFSYLDHNGTEPWYNDNVKGCNLNIIGDFLMMVRYGFKEYEFEYTKTKMLQLKYDALVATIVCILNTRWKDEMPYLNTMLLNCLHYLGEKNPEAFDVLLPQLRKSIEEKIESLKHPSGLLSENWHWFERRIIPAFRKTIRQLEAKAFDSTCGKGQIIYKSPWGYCYVKDVSRQNDFTLIRSGFIWDNNLRDFIRHTNDEVYCPLKLTSFIQVLM
jgi:hypothetical protein